MQAGKKPNVAPDEPTGAVRTCLARGRRKHSGTWVCIFWAAVCAGVVVPARVSPGQNTPEKSPAGTGPERSVLIKLVGPDGHPLAGVVAHDLRGFGSAITGPARSDELIALAPPVGRTRMVWFAHEEKKLAGLVTISSDATGPYTAKLVPWAVVSGRLVGENKKPRDGLVFLVKVGKNPILGGPEDFAYWRAPVGSDGSFRIEGIVPGLPTKAMIIEPEISFGHSGPPLNLKPGESVDLGTITVPTVKVSAGPSRIQSPPPPPKALTTAKFDESKARAEYRVDFRKEQYDIKWLRIDAQGGASRLVQPDKKGLRFTVPAGLGEGATVVTKFGIAGDFEITGTFEALSNIRPLTGWGMGPELLIKPNGGWDKFASAGRFLRTKETVYSLVHGSKVGDEKKYDAGTIPTETKAGRFRLVRTGPTLHFQVAEGESPVFQELFATEFGTEPMEFIRLAAVTGGSKQAVEVLWKDLIVRAEELPGFSGPASRPPDRYRGPLSLALGAIAVVAIGAVVWWSVSQKSRTAGGSRSSRSRRQTKAPAPAEAWDEATLTGMEQAATSYAQEHPAATSCGQRARYQFSLHQAMLHGPFIAWKALAKEDLERLGSSWEEAREKLPLLIEGSYHRGKRQGTFAYHDDHGRVSTRRYRDGRVAG
jgi:hypothetical protein